MQGPADVHYQSADVLLLQAHLGFDGATALGHWFSVMGTAKFRGFVGKLG
jgi:hypothetical protein